MILRLSISSMFVEEKEKLMEYLVNNVADIVDDEEGVRLFIELINCCNPKQKKRLVKLYMGNLKEIIDNNNLSYVTIMKLLTEVDDTVLIANSLLKELLELLPTINSCKKVFSLFFSLFSPRTNNFNILGKHEHNVEHTECKKP